MIASLLKLVTDRYDRNARLRPALLVLLPIILLVAVWWPQLWTVVGGLISLLGASGVIFLLSRYARTAGRRLQAQMTAEDGGLASTRMLRHSDQLVSPVTKSRYHDFLRSNGLPIPSAEDEAADPGHADACYQSACDWLREQTRGPAHSLLLDENIDYGFRRNLVGMKPLGMTLTVLAFVANAVMLYISRATMDTRWTLGAVLAAGLAVLLLIWIGFLRRSFVEDASVAYSQRLLAFCDMPAPAASKPKKPKKA
jgi:hypothetical protein